MAVAEEPLMLVEVAVFGFMVTVFTALPPAITFMVRGKVSAGVGVERIFPLHSPTIAVIEVVRRGRVRRAKLYYLRNLSSKAGRIKELTES